MYVDFTKWGVVIEGAVNCLVVSVLFDDGKSFDKEGKFYFSALDIN